MIDVSDYNFLNLSDYQDLEKLKVNIDFESDNNNWFSVLLEKNEDDFYFTKLVFYLYNYENWFINKKGRNRKKNLNIIK